VLNGACHLCGATDLVLTNKPLEADQGAIVPAARLSRPQRR
jgi:hypothetical protein